MPSRFPARPAILALAFPFALPALAALPSGPEAVDSRALGYYRQAAAGPDSIVFVA
mgnify:FL=1